MGPQISKNGKISNIGKKLSFLNISDKEWNFAKIHLLSVFNEQIWLFTFLKFPAWGGEFRIWLFTFVFNEQIANSSFKLPSGCFINFIT